MQKITVATSIAPRNIELQRTAIDSWLNRGLNVISLNSKEEIALLSAEFSSIKFVPTCRSALDLTGKPYVFFDDVLNVLSSCGSEICGIINSDVHLHVDNYFIEKVKKAASTNFLYASRVDITTLADTGGKIYPYGFDLFFFPTKLVSEYPSSDFCLGAPWWDYWAVLVPIAKGYQVEEIISMGISHVIHESRWQSKLHALFCRHLLNVAQSTDLLDAGKDEFISTLLPVYEADNFFLASLLYLNYFQKNATPVNFDDSGEFGSFMSAQYVTVRNELVEAKIDSYSLASELEGMRLGTESPKNEGNDDPFNSVNSLYCRAVAVLRRILNLSIKQ